MPSNRATDEELVLRCRAGERVAFDELVARYGGAAYNVALRRTHDPEAAADVAQQALLDAYCGLPSLRDPAKFAPWLRSITVHLCADQRALAVRQPQAGLNRPEPTAPDPLYELVRDEVRLTVREAVARLSRANRLAVNLFYFDGLSCREVADFCGVTVSAVKSRLYEARKALREGSTAMQDDIGTAARPMIGYSGDMAFNALFRGGQRTKDLYGGLYPQRRRDDESFWNSWEDLPELNGILRLWSYTGVVREEDGTLVGQVPLYTNADHEMFAAWHARTSQAVLRRVGDRMPELEQLAGDLRCSGADLDSLRFITVIGRLIAQGTEAVLRDGLIGSAHDWGGLGRAFVYGHLGRNLPGTGGYSTHGRGDDVRFMTFQEDMHYPGMGAFEEYGDMAVLSLLARLCRSSLAKDAVLKEADEGIQRARLSAALDHMLAGGWVVENDGHLATALPWLPWSPIDDVQRLRPLAEAICEPIADAAEELRVLASQCSFARCRFADTAYLLTSIALGYVVRDLQREGVVTPYADVVQPGRGAWLYLADQTPTPAAQV